MVSSFRLGWPDQPDLSGTYFTCGKVFFFSKTFVTSIFIVIMTIDNYKKVRGPADASNFDTYPKEKESPPDELSGWDVDFQLCN